MLRGILMLVFVFLLFVFGVLLLDAVIWGEREGIVKTDSVGENDDD